MSRIQSIDDLEPGDLILWGQGEAMRKVRAVTRGERYTYVYFAILQCSYTDRCYTIYNQHDFDQHYEGLIARGVSLRSTKLESLVQDAIEMAAKPREGDDRKIITCGAMVGRVI